MKRAGLVALAGGLLLMAVFAAALLPTTAFASENYSVDTAASLAGPTLGLADDSVPAAALLASPQGKSGSYGKCKSQGGDEQGVPELNPTYVGAAIVLTVGGVLVLTGRRRRKQLPE